MMIAAAKEQSCCMVSPEESSKRHSLEFQTPFVMSVYSLGFTGDRTYTNKQHITVGSHVQIQRDCINVLCLP
jgi:hypothetical protein